MKEPLQALTESEEAERIGLACKLVPDVKLLDAGIKLAENFAKRHNQLVQDVFATSISGTQTTSQREIILKTFEKLGISLEEQKKLLIS